MCREQKGFVEKIEEKLIQTALISSLNDQRQNIDDKQKKILCFMEFLIQAL